MLYRNDIDCPPFLGLYAKTLKTDNKKTGGFGYCHRSGMHSRSSPNPTDKFILKMPVDRVEKYDAVQASFRFGA